MTYEELLELALALGFCLEAVLTRIEADTQGVSAHFSDTRYRMDAANCKRIFDPFLTTEADTVQASTGGRLPPSRGRKILFLDDDVGFLEVTTRAIYKAGYEITSYSDPAKAVAGFAAAPESFDLVVTHLTMPELNGLDVAQRVLAARPDIPIIITAGYISPENEALAAAYGVREVISKSAPVEELCQAFGRVFGSND